MLFEKTVENISWNGIIMFIIFTEKKTFSQYFNGPFKIIIY